jgi:ribonuclease HI
VTDLNWEELKVIRTKMNAEPQCLWTTGVITKDYTTLPETEYMKAEDISLDSTQKTQKVYIDGSATKIGASAYAGWGFWSPDNEQFKENGPLKGKYQGSDRAEVRALLAALEKTIGRIEVITDNMYVRDTTNGLLTGDIVHKGKNSDLWSRIYDHMDKIVSIRWVKAHLKK